MGMALGFQLFDVPAHGLLGDVEVLGEIGYLPAAVKLQEVENFRLPRFLEHGYRTNL